MWNRIKDTIRTFMWGRNGLDDLNKLILALLLLLDILAGIMQNKLLWGMFAAVSLLFFYRMFSKSLAERQMENNQYLKMVRVAKLRYELRREYRIFVCKGCGRNIRVPKGKGRVEITCPVCGSKIIRRT